jgi:Leucine-rich repeat (LRR) protein
MHNPFKKCTTYCEGNHSKGSTNSDNSAKIAMARSKREKDEETHIEKKTSRRENREKVHAKSIPDLEEGAGMKQRTKSTAVKKRKPSKRQRSHSRETKGNNSHDDGIIPNVKHEVDKRSTRRGERKTDEQADKQKTRRGGERRTDEADKRNSKRGERRTDESRSRERAAEETSQGVREKRSKRNNKTNEAGRDFERQKKENSDRQSRKNLPDSNSSSKTEKGTSSKVVSSRSTKISDTDITSQETAGSWNGNRFSDIECHDGGNSEESPKESSPADLRIFGIPRKMFFGGIILCIVGITVFILTMLVLLFSKDDTAKSTTPLGPFSIIPSSHHSAIFSHELLTKKPTKTDPPSIFARTPATDGPTSPPVPAPSSAPALSTDRFGDLIESLFPQWMVDEASSLDASSPQYKALFWLAHTDPARLPLSTTPKEMLLERYALATVYFSTEGKGWTKGQESWMSKRPVCEWNRVVCGSRREVAALFLNENNLGGSLPTDIAFLSDLTRLTVSSNHIEGPIPSEIGSLTRLVSLDSSNNRLTGILPTELGQLTGLDTLTFSSNRLNGFLPTEFGRLTNLVSLSGSDNALDGSLPTEMGRLTRLTSLELLQNKLDGSLPNALGSLQRLARLALQNNRIVGPIPSHVGQLTSLAFLNLSENKLAGTLPSE